MTTLFERLRHHYNHHPDLLTLNHDQKSKLGRNIAVSYYQHPGAKKLERKISIEDTGTFTVMVYPDNFSLQIDKLIGEFYANLGVKKKPRVRMNKPIWSAKPQS